MTIQQDRDTRDATLSGSMDVMPSLQPRKPRPDVLGEPYPRREPGPVRSKPIFGSSLGPAALVSRLLHRMIQTGSLTVLGPDGMVERFGPGGYPHVTVRFHDSALWRRLLFNPELHVGEAYMDGTLTIEEGTLYDFLYLCTYAGDVLDSYPLQRLRRWATYPLRYLRQYNPVGKSQKNVAHHYDLSGTLYDLFLDADRQYSCAYFAHPSDSLEAAQENKKRLLATKLLLTKPGLKVLDIGSGWGGLAIHLARTADADVTGITLSKEQFQASRERVAQAGIDRNVRFALRDYRDESGMYDRIVSVGMFEHVGVSHYGTYFAHLKKLLKPDGVGVVHAIGRMEPPGGTNPWLQKYIFPGSYCPALSEVLAAVERAGLWVTDIEILRLHYAETLRCWRRHFHSNRAKIKDIYDERFCRMWEFYLAGCEVAFRNGPMMVFQIQLARRRDAVPLTRSYLAG